MSRPTGFPAAGGVSLRSLLLLLALGLTLPAIGCKVNIQFLGLRITSPSSTSDGYLTEAYSVTFTGAGGNTPFTWSQSAGTLPGGLSLDTNTGVLSGTPSGTGTFNFDITLTDALSDTATRSYTIEVFALPAITAPAAGALANAPLNGAYGPVNFTFTGGKPTQTWSVTSGSLPAGLSLNSGTGVLNGTATAVGTSNFSVSITDANGRQDTRAYSITVVDLPVITSPAAGALTVAYNGESYNGGSGVTVTASGGVTPYTFSNPGGGMPSGLSISSGGLISGTPSDTAGTFNFNIQVADSNGPPDTDTRAYSIQLFDLPTISSPAAGALPNAPQNQAYSTTWTATGGAAPLSWSISAGALPTGLSINSTTGEVSGTPTVLETANFTVQVQDANGRTDTRAHSLQIIDFPVITTPAAPGALADAYLTEAYGPINFAVTGGTPTYTWTVPNNPLPTGLTLNDSGATATIDGTPTAAGNFSFEVRVTDSIPNFDEETYTIDVYALPSITAPAAGSLPNAIQNNAYSQLFTVTGGKAPLVWSIQTGTLNNGLSQNTSTGEISGTPDTLGTENFTVRVTDANGRFVDVAYDLTVSTETTPVTTDDSYDGVGNTQLVVNAASGVLANDTGGNLTAAVNTGPSNGTLNLNADGSFDYTPNVNFRGASDSFTYDATNGQGTDTGTVTINLTGMVWYIDNNAAAGGDGRSISPFDALSDHNGNGNDQTGDFIYIFENGGGNYDGGITLQDDQQLIGEGVDLVVGAVTVFTAGSRPTLVTTGGGTVGITLGQNNTVRGLNIANTTGSGIFGNAGGTLTINTVAISGDGRAVNLSGYTLDVTLDSVEVVTANGAGVDGISLDNVAGTFTVSGTTTISTTGSRGIDITGGGTATISFATVDMTAGGLSDDGVRINSHSGSFTINSTGGGIVANASTDGLEITDMTGAVTVQGAVGNLFVISNAGTAGGNDDAIVFDNSTSLSLTNVRMHTIGNSTAEHGIEVNNANTGGTSITVTDCQFEDINGSAISINTTNDGVLNLTVTGTTITDIGVDGIFVAIDGGNVDFGMTVTGCTFDGADGGFTGASGINILGVAGSGAQGTMDMIIGTAASSNTFTDWTGDIIILQSAGTQTSLALIENNNISNSTGGSGIIAGPGDSSVMGSRVINNTVTNTSTPEIFLSFRPGAGVTATHGVFVQNNNADAYRIDRDNGSNGILIMGTVAATSSFTVPALNRTNSADITTVLTDDGNQSSGGAPSVTVVNENNNFSIVDETNIGTASP